MIRNRWIEIYRDAIVFPFFGFGINCFKMKKKKGLGFFYDDSGLTIGIFFMFTLSLMFLNRKKYLEKYSKKKETK